MEHDAWSSQVGSSFESYPNYLLIGSRIRQIAAAVQITESVFPDQNVVLGTERPHDWT